jgi:hypothetical protein
MDLVFRSEIWFREHEFEREQAKSGGIQPKRASSAAVLRRRRKMSKAERSLKSSNTLPLGAVIAGNVLAFHLVGQGGAILSGDFWAALKNTGALVPATVGLILVSVLNGQIDPITKARLVFWRWSDPLPGSEAFTRHAVRDPRVDTARLVASFGPLPTTPRDQNALWYKLYKTVGDDPSVSHAHKEFLLTRDYAVLSLLMLISLGGLALYQMPLKTALFYLVGMAGQYLLVRRAARTHGHRFVTTVLALKGAGK